MPSIEIDFSDDEREYARYERIEAMLCYWGGIGTLSAKGLELSEGPRVTAHRPRKRARPRAREARQR